MTGFDHIPLRPLRLPRQRPLLAAPDLLINRMPRLLARRPCRASRPQEAIEDAGHEQDGDGGGDDFRCRLQFLAAFRPPDVIKRAGDGLAGLQNIRAEKEEVESQNRNIETRNEMRADPGDETADDRGDAEAAYRIDESRLGLARHIVGHHFEDDGKPVFEVVGQMRLVVRDDVDALRERCGLMSREGMRRAETPRHVGRDGEHKLSGRDRLQQHFARIFSFRKQRMGRADAPSAQIGPDQIDGPGPRHENLQYALDARPVPQDEISRAGAECRSRPDQERFPAGCDRDDIDRRLGQLNFLRGTGCELDA
jgi:hypothetical protein